MNSDFVPYHIPLKNPHIAIIGEAPGAQEVKEGKPFVGRSGQLLDKNLRAAGIERRACMVANVFRIRPPQNKVAHFFLSEKKAREEGIKISKQFGKFTSGYVREEFVDEILNLQKTLQDQKPVLIITLGATPLWALTGLKGITSLRGILQPCRLVPAIPVLPTFHPSYIMRGNWHTEPVFKKDLETALTFTCENK